MRTFFGLILAILVVSWPAMAQDQPSDSVCQQNLIVNPSFEVLPADETHPSTGGSANFTEIDGWSVTGGTADQLEIQNDIFGPVPDGHHYLEVASSSSTWVSQRVQTHAGQTYSLSFSYRPRPGYDSDVEVRWNGKAVQTLPRKGAPTAWSSYTLVVEGTGKDELTFAAVDPDDPAGGGLIDRVSLCPVPGVAHECCCGANLLHAFNDDYPRLNWGIHASGHLIRFWWDQQAYSEILTVPGGVPLVAGSLHHDPFGDGVVALNEDGYPVRTVLNGNTWEVERIRHSVLDRVGPALPCALATSLNGRFRGIWLVVDGSILRLYPEGAPGEWSVDMTPIKDHGPKIVPSSLHEIWDGRIAGTLQDGNRWGIWFEDDDPEKMHFDYGEGPYLAVSRVTCCSH